MTVTIDLAREYVMQVAPDKRLINGIRVDPPQEIMANKLCALLSRSEIRDLVDVRALELAGYQLESALSAAVTKDKGLTPAQLGWVLSQIELGDDVDLPGDVSIEELRGYLAGLIVRLTHRRFPRPDQLVLRRWSGTPISAVSEMELAMEPNCWQKNRVCFAGAPVGAAADRNRAAGCPACGSTRD